MWCRRGDMVVARRDIDGMDVPRVPAGSRGTVIVATMFGSPKRVSFTISDGWGLKEFSVKVCRGDVTQLNVPAS